MLLNYNVGQKLKRCEALEHILIVSNNVKVSKSLTNLLSEDYFVCVSENSPDAISLTVCDYKPEIIVVECKIYDEVKSCVHRLRSDFSEAKIVLISSFLGDDERVDISKSECIDSFLVKPCNKSEILNLINKKKKHKFKKNNEIDSRLIHSIVESYTTKNVVLCRSYTRISGHISRLKSYIDCDLNYVCDLLAYYLLVIASLDDEHISYLLAGVHSNKEIISVLVDKIYKLQQSSKINLVDFDTKPLHDMLYINKRYNGKGFPKDSVSGAKIPIASRILRVLFDFHCLAEKGKSSGESMFILNNRSGWYDTGILKSFNASLGSEAQFYDREVYPLGLQRNMIMAQDLYGVVKGRKVLIIKNGQCLDEKNIDYIHRHAQDILDITEPVLIRESVVLHEEENA